MDCPNGPTFMPTRKRELLPYVLAATKRREPRARCSAVKQFDAREFKGDDNLGDSAGVGRGRAALEIGDSFLGDAGVVRQLLLRPIEKGAGGAALEPVQRHS